MNNIICKNCGTANPFHQLTCVSCRAYLRERVYNLDLWQLLENIIESPIKGFTKIIHSEQKNFIIFILILFSLKFFINTVFFFLLNAKSDFFSINGIRNYLIVLATVCLIMIVFTFLIKLTNRFLLNISRAKDIFSILSYSLVPYLFALIVLFPLELIFFGQYLFSRNPSPFVIKETTAYVMLVLEILMIIWAFFLSIMALFTLTKSRFYSITMGILFSLFILGSQYLLSFYIFGE